MSYSEMARDVLAFMDKVCEVSGNSGNANGDGGNNNNSKAVIVGHSMGGKVAQSLALMHPDRVAGLVVLDIAPVRYYSQRGGGEEGSGSAWSAVEDIVRNTASIDLESGEYATKRDVDAALRNSGMLQDPALRAFVLTNLEQTRAASSSASASSGDSGDDPSTPPLRWKVHWDGIVRELDRIAGFDAHDVVLDDSVDGSADLIRRHNKYDGDVFFIHGGASRFVRSSYMSTIADFFPNHMLTTIRGVGHWVHAEAPDDTIALLKKYLDR